jgi:hypothetical protein
MDWSKYGEWRHPKEWWQIQLLEYIKIKHPDRLKFNPTIISVEETHIWFGMRKHYGHLRLSKKAIIETLNETSNNREQRV